MKIRPKLTIIMLLVSLGALVMLAIGTRYYLEKDNKQNVAALDACMTEIEDEVYYRSLHSQSVISEIKLERMRMLLDDAFHRIEICTKNCAKYMENCYRDGGMKDKGLYRVAMAKIIKEAQENDLIKFIAYQDETEKYLVYSDKKGNLNWIPDDYFFYLTDEDTPKDEVFWGISSFADGRQCYSASIDMYSGNEIVGSMIIEFSIDDILEDASSYVDPDSITDADVYESVDKENDNIFILDEKRTVFAQMASVNSDLAQLSTERYKRLQEYARSEAETYDLWGHPEYGASTYYSDDEDQFYISIVPVKHLKWLVCAYIPSERFENSYLKVKNAVSEAYSEIKTNRVKLARESFAVQLIFLAVVICIVVLISALFAAHFTKPILRLQNGVKRMQEGDLDAKVEIRSTDEIGLLTAEFNDMSDKLKTYLANITEMTAKEERVQAEMDMAAMVQKSMLPEEDLIVQGAVIRGTMKPAKAVGGDFFDFFKIDDHRIGFFIADVSDKGMAAAMFMSVGKTLLRELNAVEKDPLVVMNRVNNMLCRNNRQMQFITAFEGILDLQTGVLSYVNAGHEKPVLYRAAQKKASLFEIEGSFPLAIVEDAPYEIGTITLNPGDCLLQYTDGATEAINEKEEMYGEARLVAAFEKSILQEDVFAGLFDEMNHYTGDLPAFDDTAFVLVRYLGPNNEEEKE